MSAKKITRSLDVYVRVSRVGGREGESYITEAVQEERCRALATARGLAVGQVFVDRDQSGGKMVRPAFAEALARIEAGVSGGLIVARLDRFARTLLGGLQTLEQVRTGGRGADDVVAAGGLLLERARRPATAAEPRLSGRGPLRRLREGGRAPAAGRARAVQGRAGAAGKDPRRLQERWRGAAARRRAFALRRLRLPPLARHDQSTRQGVRLLPLQIQPRLPEQGQHLGHPDRALPGRDRAPLPRHR